jgi:hypothetical protein
MAFKVRVFGHRGVTPIKFVGQTQHSTDSILLPVQPYEWSQVLELASDEDPLSASIASRPIPKDAAVFIIVEVPEGHAIRYELNSGQREGGVRPVSDQSPILSGTKMLHWGQGWVLAIKDAADLP